MATALCQLTNIYGQTFLTLPVAVGCFELTNLYQSLRKSFVTILLRIVKFLYMTNGSVSLIFGFVLAISGLKLTFNNLDF